MTFMYAALHRLKPTGHFSLANKFKYTSSMFRAAFTFLFHTVLQRRVLTRMHII